MDEKQPFLCTADLTKFTLNYQEIPLWCIVEITGYLVVIIKDARGGKVLTLAAAGIPAIA